MISLLSACLFLASAPAEILWSPLYEPGCGGAIVSVAVSPHNARHLVSGGDMLGTASSFAGVEEAGTAGVLAL